MSLFYCLANLLPQTIFDSDGERAKCCGDRLGQTGGDPESVPATSEQPQAIWFPEDDGYHPSVNIFPSLCFICT